MREQTKPVLVVGAGLAGAVYARCLADARCRVVVIDKRDHIAGNAFDEVGPDSVRVHRYGPHLFHTANQKVLAWIRRFADWCPYNHKVRALLPSRQLAPLPINLDTLNIVFDLKLEGAAEADAHLKRVAVEIDQPANAAEYLASKIGTELTELFFRPYTKKMWGHDLEALSPSIVKRIPLRTDRYDSYFRESETQLLPKLGYTNFVSRILDHPLIEVRLSSAFDQGMLSDYRYCFASIAIDEYYECCEGPLPYRSLRFHHRSVDTAQIEHPWANSQETFSVVNFTDAGPYTRETAWHRLPCHLEAEAGRRTFTREEPCDYTENKLERFYPINDAEGLNAAAYARYQKLAAGDRDIITFIGRCGTYRYLDMDQVINQSLTGAQNWIENQDAFS